MPRLSKNLYSWVKKIHNKSTLIFVPDQVFFFGHFNANVINL